MVLKRIKEIIAEQLGLGVDEIEDTTNLQSDLDADSLDLFQIVNEIEDEFDVKIENAEEISTPLDAAKEVEKQI